MAKYILQNSVYIATREGMVLFTAGKVIDEAILTFPIQRFIDAGAKLADADNPDGQATVAVIRKNADFRGNAPSNDPVWSGDLGPPAFQLVANLAARDAIPAILRRVGMHVFLQDAATTYHLGPGLTNADWLIDTTSISTTLTSASGIVITEPFTLQYTVGADFGTGVGKVLQATKAAVEAVLGLGSGFVKAASGVLSVASIVAADLPALTGDVTGPYTANVVSAVHGASVPVAGALVTGNVLQVTGASTLGYGPVNLAGGAGFVTGVLPSGNQVAQTMGGDVTGTTSSSVVAKVNGTTVPVGGALVTGNGLYVTGVAALSYAALNLAGGGGYVTGLLPTANQVAQTMGGDASGTTNATTNVRINGATVPAAGALVTGNTLQVATPTTLSYAALNLAGGANYVTGQLPSGNQVAQTMGGDVLGTTAASIVGFINGSSVPAGGALVTGNVLQVSGLSALSYGPVNLAGGAHFVTGTLPAANQASQTVGGDLSGTTASATVLAINGTTFAPGGALVTGNGVHVVSPSSVAYSALNLAGGSGFVTGTLPAGNQAAQTMSGDVTGTTSSNVVMFINGSSVPAGGSLVTGNTLRVSGAAALTYSALNLAGGSGFVTGLLPTANQAAQVLGGDATGTTAAVVNIAVNGATVPAAGALTTGNGLYVTGASALSYSALNLAGGAGFVTGVLPRGNQQAQNLTGDATGTTAANTVTNLTGSGGLVTVPTAFFAMGTNPALTGYVQLPNNVTGMAFRNAANTADISAVSTNSSNTLIFGSSANLTQVSGTNVQLLAGGVQTVLVSSAALQFFLGIGSPTIGQVAKATDVAPQDLTVKSQQPVPGATVNVVPGNLALDVGTPISGTTYAAVQFKNNGVTPAAMGFDGTNPFLTMASATTATLGQLRFPNATNILAARNAANTANVHAMSLSSANVLIVGADIAGANVNNAAVSLYTGSTGLLIYPNTTTTANAFSFLNNTFNSGAGQSSPVWKHTIQPGDTLPTALTIRSQQPFATATGANRVPGNLVLDVGTPTNAGTTYAAVQLTNNGATQFNFGFDGTNPFVQVGSTNTSASAGIRFPNAVTILSARNAANSGDLTLLSTNASNTFVVGNSANGATALNGTNVSLATSLFQFQTAQASPVFVHQAQTADAATTALTIRSQQPFSTATGTNRIPGNIVLDAGTPTNAGTVYSAINMTWNGSAQIQHGFDGTNPFLTMGTSNQATTSFVRFPNAVGVLAARNAANTADCTLLSLTSGNILNIGADTATANINNAQISLYAGAAAGIVIFPNTTASNNAFRFQANVFSSGLGQTSPVWLHSAQGSDAATTNLSVRAQDAFASAVTNVNGGALLLQGGRATLDGTTGLRGGVRLVLSSAGIVMGEVAEVAVGRRVVAFNRTLAITATQVPSGDLLAYWGDALTVPTTNPIGGGLGYSSTGAGSWRGTGGTTTTYAPS